MPSFDQLLANSLSFRVGKQGVLPDPKDERGPFSQILNWRLLRGSHEFPGPDGGTCFNEAAVVASGLSYRAVSMADDLPACFSPVIGAYTILLNDQMPDGPRQQLLPYVTRLAGTADELPVECRRTKLLALAAVRVFAANALGRAGLHDQAATWAAVPDLDAAVALRPELGVERALRFTTDAAWKAAIGARACSLHPSLCLEATHDAAHAAFNAACAAVRAARNSEAQHEVWQEALSALDGILAIGRQAEPVDLMIASKRMEQAKPAAG